MKNTLLTPFQRQLLRRKLSEDIPKLYRQRIEIMLMADEGKSQGAICENLRCSPATVRHWIHVAKSGIAHQWEDCPLGRPKKVTTEYLARLQKLLGSSPGDYGYSFQRWTVNWLSRHLTKEFGIKLSDRHIKRLMEQQGLSTKNNQGKTTVNTGNPSILIQDLKSDTPLEDPVISYITPTLDTHLKTYGAKSTRLCAVSRTVQPGSRSFFLPSRISQLLLTV